MFGSRWLGIARWWVEKSSLVQPMICPDPVLLVTVSPYHFFEYRIVAGWWSNVKKTQKVLMLNQRIPQLQVGLQTYPTGEIDPSQPPSWIRTISGGPLWSVRFGQWIYVSPIWCDPWPSLTQQRSFPRNKRSASCWAFLMETTTVSSTRGSLWGWWRLSIMA